MPHAKSKQDPERVRNGAGGSSIASEVQARSRKKSKSQATATTTAATAMCNMDSHDCPPRAGAGADADADPSSTAIIASGSNTRGIRQLRRSASCAAMPTGRFDSNTVTSTGTSSSPDRVPPGDREAAAAAGLGCNMIRNDSSDSVNLPHDDMTVLLCMHSAEHEGASGSSPAASSSREGAAAAGTCRSGYPSGETSSSAGDGQQQQRRCDACYQDAGSSGDDDDSLLLLLPDAKLGIPSEESEPEVVMDQQDSGTATTDWNGFWIPVVGNDDADHMMHLMSSEVGSGPGAAGPRIMQQQQQQQQQQEQGESFFPAVDGHGSSHVTVVAYGAPAGILRTASAQEHHHGQQQQQSSDDDRSGFLLEPMFTTSRGIYSSSSPSRSRTSPMSTLRRAEAEEEDSETAAPAAAAAARGRGDHVHMPHQFKQHSSSAAAAHLEVDFCESLLNVEDQQQQQANVNSSASRIFMSGIMSDDVMSMSNLDTINYCGHTSTSSAAATPGPAANMWMPMMDQWMEDRSNSLAAAAQIQQQQQQEVEWTCNYPQAGPPAAYLPPAAHHLIGVGATAYNAMIQQQIAPGGRHVFPPPSAPHMSTHLPFMHTSPTTTMASSSQLAMGGGRSLSTSALHSDPCTTTATSSIFTNTSGGCIPPLRRHSAAVKRSLSFMQSRDEDDAHNPCSAADRASAGVGVISNNNNNLDNASDAPVAHTAATTSAVAPLGLKLGIGNNSSTTSSGCATVADTTTVTSLRPGIDDAAAQLSALLYTKSRTDIGNNAISQYHKLAFQNSFYNNNNSSKLDSCPSSSGVGLASKNAARRRHGTATDPQSIAARTRRERFSDRIRILQSLVPNGERLDTVSMLGQTLEYVRFLQHQVWQLYNGTSSAPISASTHVHGAAAAAAAAATNLAAQVASAESLAASFLSSMAQRQAAAAATPSPELLSSSSSSNSNNNTNSSSSNGSGSKLAAAAGLGLVDKWKKLAASPHVPAEFTPVA